MALAKRIAVNEDLGASNLVVRTRADSVRYAIASTMMEGGAVTDDTERLLNDWADGKLDDDQLMEQILAGCRLSA